MLSPITSKETIDVLLEVVSRWNAIILRVEKCILFLERIMLGMDPNRYSSSQQHIAFCKNISSNLSRVNESDLTVVEKVKLLFDDLDSVNEKLVGLVAFVKDPQFSKYMIGSSSSSAYSEIKKAQEDLTFLFSQHTNRLDSDLNKLSILLVSNVKDNDLDNFVFGRKLNSFEINVLNHLMQKKPTADLRRIIETQKINALSATTLDDSYPFNLTRFNLEPLTKSESLIDILQQENIKGDSLQNAQAHIIIINKNIGSPMEFNIASLVDPNYIAQHDFAIKPSQGLSKKILKKYETVRWVDKSWARPENFGQAIESYGDEHNDKKLVLDTIDGKTYRKLDSSPEVVDFLLRGRSTLVQQYHSLHEDKILSRCFDRDLTICLEKYKNRPEQKYSADDTMKLVRDALHKWMKNKLDDGEFPDVGSLRGLYIDRDMIVDLLSNTLQLQTPRRGSAIEQSITYMQKVSTISKNFAMQFGDKWSKESLTDYLFRGNANQNILSLFDRAVNSAVEDLHRLGVWIEYDDSLKLYAISELQITM